MLSSTTLFSNNRKLQRARPLGGLEHAKAISLASFSPSKIRGTAGTARCLRLSTATYLFTEISFASMIASVVPTVVLCLLLRRPPMVEVFHYTTLISLGSG